MESNSKIILTRDIDIFIKIWTSPKEVFQYINENQYNKYSIILLVFAGISNTFSNMASKNFGDTQDLYNIIGVGIISGGFIGWVFYYIYSFLIAWTGKIFNGQGNATSILRIISYSMIPFSLTIILLIPQIWIYGIAIFQAGGHHYSANFFSNLIIYISMILEFVLGLWSIILLIIGISIVQKISIWSAIWNFLLAGITPVIAIIFLAIIFK